MPSLARFDHRRDGSLWATLEQSVATIDELERRKAKLEREARQLEEISRVRMGELAQRFGQELTALG